MKHWMKKACAAILGGMVALTATTMTATAAPVPAGSEYVALGDSFASVGSLTQPQALTHPFCGKAADNYPHVLASQLNLNLVDGTCGFARTNDYWDPQNFPLPGMALQAQREHLGPNTKLVTLTLGGNDSGTMAIGPCVLTWATSLGNCRQSMGVASEYLINTTDNFAGKNLEGRLNDIVADIRHQAPNAQIVLTGYYNIFRSDMQCVENGFLSQDDLLYIQNDFIGQLNSISQRVAANHGAIFVSAPDDLLSCGPVGQRNASFTGVFDNALPFHPTSQGQAAMANAIAAAL